MRLRKRLGAVVLVLGMGLALMGQDCNLSQINIDQLSDDELQTYVTQLLAPVNVNEADLAATIGKDQLRQAATQAFQDVLLFQGGQLAAPGQSLSNAQQSIATTLFDAYLLDEVHLQNPQLYAGVDAHMDE